MKNNNFGLIVRLIPALAVIAAFITLAFVWSQPETRGGAFFYFMLLGIYATVMVFFSDIIFKLGSKAPTLRTPVITTAVIHFIFVVIIFRLRFTLNIGDVYFILATLIGASIQVAVSLILCKSVQNIEAQSGVQTQEKNARMVRDVLLMELADGFRKAPEVSGNKDVSRKLEMLTNTWKFSPAQDTASSMQTTEEINTGIKSLIKNISAEKPETEQILGEMDDILSLIERRKKLLQIK